MFSQNLTVYLSDKTFTNNVLLQKGYVYKIKVRITGTLKFMS